MRECLLVQNSPSDNSVVVGRQGVAVRLLGIVAKVKKAHLKVFLGFSHCD